jgi:hypothetical protein
LKQRLDRLLAISKDRAQLAPTLIAGADDLAERNSFSGEVSRDGAA